ncbi:MAG: DUF4177 domain-containing protein [Proteobacteria bacterium]|nr:DUF4177 domain-containing protein [Pseudomonadota bacterium]MBS0574302.1 DUF4177 domain-containing protein [Pseudomonadota bacterium]
MNSYEYKVLPAPARGDKVRGVKTTEDRFAHALSAALNAQARDGWEFLRAETLPAEERTGFTGRRTVYLNLLVFRRPVDEEARADQPAAGRPAAPRIAPLAEGKAPRLGPATGSDATDL